MKTEKELQKFLTKTFGEFDEFKKQFFSIKFGALPVAAHPHPRTIAKMQNKDNWSASFKELDELYSVCFVCRSQGIFVGCKLCPKVIAGGCDGLRAEANNEEHRIILKENQKRKKKRKAKGGRKK